MVVGGRRGYYARRPPHRRTPEIVAIWRIDQHRKAGRSDTHTARARRVTEDLVLRPGQTIEEPGLSVEVVHGEDAVRLQAVARRLERLFREQVTLESNRRLAR